MGSMVVEQAGVKESCKERGGEKMQVVGLTGGIASGKSTVSNLFRAASVPVVDADIVACDKDIKFTDAPTYAETNEQQTDHLPNVLEHLKFKMSESFLRLIELMQVQHKDVAAVFSNLSSRRSMKESKAVKDQHRVSKGRRSPARLPVRTLHIGEFKVDRSDELDIVAKFCYQTQKFVWQLCRDGWSSRMDIFWKDIVAISACFDDERFETLKIKVRCQPKFYSADKPHRGKFHRWKECGDFTNGFASRFKDHYLEIEKGTLEKSYGKLLYSDQKLLMLSFISVPKEIQRFKRRRSYVPSNPRQLSHIANRGSIFIPTQQIGMFGLPVSSSAANFPSITGTMQGMTMNSSYSATNTAGYEDLQVYDMHHMIQLTNEVHHNLGYDQMMILQDRQKPSADGSLPETANSSSRGARSIN